MLGIRCSREAVDGASAGDRAIMASPEVLESFGNLTLCQHWGLSFVETAVKHVTEVLGSCWKDVSQILAHTWKSPSGKEKEGDAAEDFVVKKLTDKDFLDLLQEPVYLISGRRYCHFKTEPGQL